MRRTRTNVSMARGGVARDSTARARVKTPRYSCEVAPVDGAVAGGAWATGDEPFHSASPLPSIAEAALRQHPSTFWRTPCDASSDRTLGASLRSLLRFPTAPFGCVLVAPLRAHHCWIRA